MQYAACMARATVLPMRTAVPWQTAIRARRRALGLTQQELANRAGLSLRTVVAIEHGEANPRLSVLRACLDALGLVISLAEGP